MLFVLGLRHCKVLSILHHRFQTLRLIMLVLVVVVRCVLLQDLVNDLYLRLMELSMSRFLLTKLLAEVYRLFFIFGHAKQGNTAVLVAGPAAYFGHRTFIRIFHGCGGCCRHL